MGTGAYHGYYDDQMKDKFSSRAQIQSDIISGNTIRLFVVLRADNEEAVRKNCNYDSLTTNLDTARWRVDLHCLQAFNKIFINDSLVQDIKWKFHYKTGTRQKGLLTWINVRELPEGQHELVLKYPGEKGDRVMASIPFYREYPSGIIQPKPMDKNEEEADFMEIKPLLLK